MKTTLNYEERLGEVWKHCQRGLVYPSPHATFATFWLKTPTGEPIKKSHLAELMAAFRQEINTRETLQNKNTSVVLGVSFKNWAAICEEYDMSLPKGMHLNFPSKEDKYTSDVFSASKGVFDNSHGDIWFHIKSDKEAACDEVLKLVVDALKSHTEKYVAQKAASKSNQEDGHKVKYLAAVFLRI